MTINDDMNIRIWNAQSGELLKVSPEKTLKNEKNTKFIYQRDSPRFLYIISYFFANILSIFPIDQNQNGYFQIFDIWKLKMLSNVKVSDDHLIDFHFCLKTFEVLIIGKAKFKLRKYLNR